MKIYNVFNDNADFSGIAKDPPKSISKAMHYGFVDLNEKGTEPAAAIVIKFLGLGLDPRDEYPEFQVDHLFLSFHLGSKIRIILFIGRLMNLKS